MSKQSFLLVDAGNTRLKWATSTPSGSLRVAGDIATSAVKPTWIKSLARKFHRHQLVLASVVPKLVPDFRRAFVKRFVVVTGNSPHLGLAFDYPKPAEIGADRLAAAVAISAAGHFPAIIVACGTATAFTVLDPKGRLCGGVIAPGLQTQLDALIGATAQLPTTKLSVPRKALARSTQEAIRAGVVLNFVGGVKEILRRLIAELPGTSTPPIILTGGNAPMLAKLIEMPTTLRPLLVFEGLRMIGVRTFIQKP